MYVAKTFTVGGRGLERVGRVKVNTTFFFLFFFFLSFFFLFFFASVG